MGITIEKWIIAQKWMQIALNAKKHGILASKFSLKCEGSHKNIGIVDFLMLKIRCLFKIGIVGTYR